MGARLMNTAGLVLRHDAWDGARHDGGSPR
ncbi:hypothetical protein KC8_10395 [Sphingomonas sp. KC8]|nr:hypothetical protein KC8_10395 [Sphingomonas sp. KC8]